MGLHFFEGPAKQTHFHWWPMIHPQLFCLWLVNLLLTLLIVFHWSCPQFFSLVIKATPSPLVTIEVAPSFLFVTSKLPPSRFFGFQWRGPPFPSVPHCGTVKHCHHFCWWLVKQPHHFYFMACKHPPPHVVYSEAVLQGDLVKKGAFYSSILI